MARKIAPILVAVALLLGGALPVVWAARFQQGRVRRIHACVGLIPAPGDPEAVNPALSPNPNPYLFFVLDQRKDLKPDGWEFVNPAAQALATPAQSARWAAITGNAGALPVATPLKIQHGAYWEVPISEENFRKLAEMDLIYIPIVAQVGAAPNTRNVWFTEAQRRILMRLADAGVTLWIDWAVQGPTQDGGMGGPWSNPATRNPFFTNLDFASFAGSAQAPGVGHPLIAGQFVFQPGEAQQIGAAYGANPPSTNRALATRVPDIQPGANFAAVVPVSPPRVDRAYVAAARYGAGFIVGTAGNVGFAIAGQITTGTPASLANAVVDLGRAEPEDLKFVYNMVAWRTEVTAQQKDPRHTADSGVQINGMIEQGSYPYLMRPATPGQPWIPYPPPAPAPLPPNPVSPVILNGAVVHPTRYVLGAGGPVVNELNAFELFPQDDFDGNGFPDDGVGSGGFLAGGNQPVTDRLLDLSLGQPYDRLMTLGPDTPGGGVTLPLITGICIGEVPVPGDPMGQFAKPYLFVAGARGGASSTGLFSVPAPRPGSAVAADYWAPGTVQTAPAGLNVDFTGAPGFAVVPGAGNAVTAQLYAGGLHNAPLFGGGGKLVALDVGPNGAMATAWYYPPNQESNRLGALSGPVVTAQVEDQATGTIDTMVFVTSVASANPTGAQVGGMAGDTTGKVEGFVVATKGDVLAFPVGNAAPGGTVPNAGRRFVSARLLNIPPGIGVIPQANELQWDPTKHYEVRVIDRASGYVVARYLPGSLTLLPDGMGGQVELPPPPPAFAAPGQPNVWDLERFVLVADYSPKPVPVDGTPLGGQGYTIRPRFLPATPYERGPGGNQLQPTGVAGGVAVGRDNLIYYGTGLGYLCAAEWRRGRAHFRWKFRGLEYQDQTGQSTNVDPSSPAYLDDYAFVAAPAAGRRIVFAARGRGGAPGTVYVFEPDAVIRFRLPVPGGSLAPAKAQDVMLRADHGIGIAPNSPWILANQQPWGRAPNQFVVDPDTATVTFLNMENISLDLSQAKTPEELAAMGIAIDTGGRPAVPIQWCFRNAGAGEPSTAAPATAWVPIPLVAIYQTPVPRAASAPPPAEKWTSGPVIAGDRIYLMGASGYLHEIPLDPKTQDPAFPRFRNAAGALTTWTDAYNCGNTSLYGESLRRYRNVAYDGTYNPAQPPVQPAPAVGNGIVAVASTRGLTLYASPNVLVADSNRVVEASGDSAALAVTEVVRKDRTDDSEFPIPTDPALANTRGRPIVTERRALNRPSVVRRLGRGSSLTSLFLSSAPTSGSPDSPDSIRESTEWAEESYLVADTGNNRCVEFTAVGKAIWECRDFQDPFGILPPGEPLTLSGPMDVQRWVETEVLPGGGRVTVVHTLIADTGNTRIVEIVDKVAYQQGQYGPGSFVTIPGQVGADGSPIRWYHVLVWATQTNAQGLRLRYRTAQRIYWPDGTNRPIPLPGASPSAQPAEPFPPFLPPERFLSYTMAAVNGQRVTYPLPPGVGSALSNYFVVYTGTTPGLESLRPESRPGGDSILFLRGRWKVENPAVGPQRSGGTGSFPFRERTPGGVERFTQGVVDPNLPILTEIHDEWVPGAMGQPPVVHRLSGVQSVQMTIRADVKFAPDRYQAGVSVDGMRVPFFLIADQDGVWECRMLPGALVPPAPPLENPAQFRLAWALTGDDYGYLTGGPGMPMPGAAPGRALTAASARRIANGYVLIASRTAAREQPSGAPLRFVGPDVFLLRPADFLTIFERPGTPYLATFPQTRGWQPDRWVGGGVTRSPSIRWRAAEPADPYAAPTPVGPLSGGGNAPQLLGSYVPVQPNYADVVF